MLLHLGPNVITFRTLLHLGQLLHLGLQQTPLRLFHFQLDLSISLLCFWRLRRKPTAVLLNHFGLYKTFRRHAKPFHLTVGRLMRY